MLLGAGAVTLLALPFWPPDDEGWDQLGWIILTMAAVVVVAVPAGAITLGVRLRRAGDPHPVLTGAVVVPVALLLGVVTAGAGALLAPPVAFWLVSGFSRRRGGGAGAGSGVWQRAAVAVLVCGLASAWTLDELGYRFGGLLHGELVVWALCLPVLVVVPVGLLVRRVPWWSLVAGVMVMAALVALGVPNAVEDSHASLARLEHTVSSLDAPVDQRVVVRQTARNQQRIDEDRLWTIVVQTAPEDGQAAEMPSALRAGAGGGLPQGDRSVDIVGLPLPATAEGRAAAAQWEASLRAQGWQQDRARARARTRTGSRPISTWQARQSWPSALRAVPGSSTGPGSRPGSCRTTTAPSWWCPRVREVRRHAVPTPPSSSNTCSVVLSTGRAWWPEPSTGSCQEQRLSVVAPSVLTSTRQRSGRDAVDDQRWRTCPHPQTARRRSTRRSPRSTDSSARVR